MALGSCQGGCFMIFAKRLKEVMEGHGVTQAELSRRLGLSPGTIRDYCSGKIKPSVDVLVEICKLFGESADYLLGLVD